MTAGTAGAKEKVGSSVEGDIPPLWYFALAIPGGLGLLWLAEKAMGAINELAWVWFPLGR